MLLRRVGHRVFTLGERQRTEVDLPDLQRRAGRNLQQALVGLVLENRAQGFVTRHQAGERLLQRRVVQTTSKAHCTRQVVGATVRVQLPQKPHALLRVGQRLTILGFDALRYRKTGEIHALLVQGRKEHLALSQGQPDKPASKFQGVFSIHFLASGFSGQEAQRHVVPIKRMQTGKISE